VSREESAAQARDHRADRDDAAISLRSVSRRYGGITAIDDVTLSISRGERVGLIGPNGAGKTTLVKLISGEVRPSSGSIELLGADVTRKKLHGRARQGLARTFQITELFPELTVRENLTLGAGPNAKNPDWRSAAKTFGLEDFSEQPVKTLGYGQQRQVELAMSLMQDPKILLLDEPAAGLDTDDRSRVREIIERLPGDLTLLLIEHDVDLVLSVSSRVVCLAQGALVADETPAEIANNPEVKRIYLGAGKRA
jgi:branched-chain amino acid transport system ATP-binding protein